MTLTHVLSLILNDLEQALRQGEDKVIYRVNDTEQWQVGVLAILLDYQLIKLISAAQSIECSACENHCFMDVIHYKSGNQIGEPTRSYIVCDDSEKQAQMGRIEVSQTQLKQWQVSIKNLGLLLATLLGFENVSLNNKSLNKDFIPLGMLSSPNGRQWVSLNKKPLSLDLNQVQIPITELLFVDDSKLTIDHARIDAVLAVKQPIKAKDYQSNTDKREQSKVNTQAMYQSWQDEYEKLKRTTPNKTKEWYAYQISKMPIAQSGSPANITRVLKN